MCLGDTCELKALRPSWKGANQVLQRIVKSVHLKGFRAPIFDKGIIDAIAETQDWTFLQRIDWIRAVLKV